MSIDPPVGDWGSHRLQPAPPPWPNQAGGYPPGWAPPPGPSWQPTETPPDAHSGTGGPSKLWYAVGAIVFGVGFVILAAGGAKMYDAYNTVPSRESTFAAGESTTVHFDAGETRVVFVDHKDNGQAKCKATDARGADVAVERVNHPRRLHNWRSIFSVTATDAGNYSVSCTGGRFDRFGVGGDVTEGSTPTLAYMVGGYILAMAGFVGAIGVARRRYRNRLQHST